MADQQTTQTREEKLERAIDKGVTGTLQVYSAGGLTNIAPQNFTELLEFSKAMATAGVAVRAAFRNNPGACLALSMQSLRWGMDPFAVTNKAYIVKNKAGEDQIAYESQLVHAVVNKLAPLQRRLEVTYEGTGTAMKCKVVGYLKGEGDRKFEYESPSVVNIGVQNSPLWKNDVQQQLHYYSVRAWARRHVPEVLLGVYTDDDVEMLDAARHQGPDNARDITPPPRPTAQTIDQRGDPAEHQRIQDEIKADLPKDFTIWDHTGTEIATGLGPRAYHLRMVDEITEAARSGHLGTFEAFAENNNEMIAHLHKLNFIDHAFGLAENISSYLKRLEQKPATEAPPASPSPVVAEASDGANQGIAAPSEADNSPVIDQEDDPGTDEPEDETLTSGPENGPTEGNEDEGQQDTETESSGPGEEENSAGAGSSEPPAEFIYIDNAGRSRFFSDPAIWRTFILKGINHPKVTPDIIRKLRDQNQELFANMTAWGGKYAEEVAIVEKAIAEKLA